MQKITFTDGNDIMFDVSLDGKQWKLRMTWNTLGFWTFSIWTLEKEPIINNMRVMPMIPLTENKHCFDIPTGDFWVLSKSETLDRYSFLDGRAALIYTTKSEFNVEDFFNE